MNFRGALQRHGPDNLTGWCCDLDAPETPVPLDLYWGDVRLRTIRSEHPHPGIQSRFGVATAAFYFTVREGLNNLLPAGTFLELRLPDGTPLAAPQTEAFAPFGKAEDGGAALRAQLAEGYIVDKWGSLKLPFCAKSAADRALYAAGIADLTVYFADRFGLTLFPHYGTLLGYARARAFIEHDDDTDLSYVVELDRLEAVADHFFGLAEALIHDGHAVTVTAAGQMNVSLKDQAHHGPDIFTSWQPSDGSFWTYFGVSGELPEPLTFFEDRFEGVSVQIPHQYERILALTYGPGWRRPDPNFNWSARPASLKETMNRFRLLGEPRVEMMRRLRRSILESVS
jgi:hypothetical protein